MRRKKWMVVLAPLGLALFIFVGGEVVMHLWNWNLPAVFGWRQITYWQALGLFALCRILFGNLGMHGRRHSGFGRRMTARWEQMTPEEREKFRQGMRGRCGSFDPPSAAPTGENKA